jgi:hypothetical protein
VNDETPAGALLSFADPEFHDAIVRMLDSLLKMHNEVLSHMQICSLEYVLTRVQVLRVVSEIDSNEAKRKENGYHNFLFSVALPSPDLSSLPYEVPRHLHFAS